MPSAAKNPNFTAVPAETVKRTVSRACSPEPLLVAFMGARLLG
jgi:hypothetical protein